MAKRPPHATGSPEPQEPLFFTRLTAARLLKGLETIPMQELPEMIDMAVRSQDYATALVLSLETDRRAGLMVFREGASG